MTGSRLLSQLTGLERLAFMVIASAGQWRLQPDLPVPAICVRVERQVVQSQNQS